MEKRITRFSFFLLSASLILLLSCNGDVMFSDSHIMENNTWELMNNVSFNLPVDDTISSSNISFSIRTGSAYPFRNIYLFVSTTAPDGKILTDTLQYYLADESGKWYGKGFGDISELSLPYKSNVYFPMKGTYRFSVRHGMRAEDLKGVYDFGMRVEKISK